MEVRSNKKRELNQIVLLVKLHTQYCDQMSV